MNIVQKTRRLLSSPGRRSKIFCIGYNKTGTTTLEQVLRKLGYRLPDQMKQERLVVDAYFRGNFAPLKKLCGKYDAFQDMPFSQGAAYAVADGLFPGSRFILTVRDPASWFDSLTRFHLQGILARVGVRELSDFNESTFKDKDVYIARNYLYNVMKRHASVVVDNQTRHDWSLVYDREHRIRSYVARNEEIIKYFQDRPGQLLVIDFSRETDNSKIVDFLGLPRSHVDPLPHLNRSR
ncbi:MAG: hypothetical protein H6959_05155 [Chromatiaceae bacterium]|nr:hypothetical protein [Chromatiaceae bacterium]MCP5422283.1 hypothetical protein [Chromatiaceae bacterium]